MLLRGGMYALPQQIQLYAFILGAVVGQFWFNLVRLLCNIASLHQTVSRHRAALTQLFKDFFKWMRWTE